MGKRRRKLQPGQKHATSFAKVQQPLHSSEQPATENNDVDDSAKAGSDIAVVGAGPARLTLVRILLKVRILRYSSSRTRAMSDEQSQGGLLDLLSEAGQPTLKGCSLFSDWETHCRCDEEDLTIVANSNRIHFSIQGE
ncbi:hypothetical protein IF1G_06431 [Cordyceps javanica]|uniref:Uncharacterized protein n=1 Tax=Cordyceps javanica TaxID=43265 RepID=A0A545V153_9HYPO|nr:hypothetical protein IF1G_06431 [Cordyceps javanica]